MEFKNAITLFHLFARSYFSCTHLTSDSSPLCIKALIEKALKCNDGYDFSFAMVEKHET